MGGDGRRNALGSAASAYLRSAMHQPVAWMEWGERAFERAAREDKPILLDIGAVWCHWCHVMDRESYEDAETARIINEHFVAGKMPLIMFIIKKPEIVKYYTERIESLFSGS